ncbi:MAG: DnaJ domain-containing protein [Deltaproteobacteria bacterium]|nr:MAG: DnaJ domain-containing protein [Deltaproteobacteria bacterium]
MSEHKYYGVLGLRKDASLQEIKRRFRQLALRFHPDRDPGNPRSEERFKLVAEAYHVLSDSRRRHIYDRKGYQGLKAQGYRGFQRTEDVLKHFGSEFAQFLGIGGVSLQRGPLRGADLCYELELTAEEATMGGRKSIEVTTTETCSKCQGRGLTPTTEVQVCPRCQGTGEYNEVSSIFAATGVCSRCNGNGNLRQTTCDTCDGGGRREVHKSLLVNVPAGIENSTRLKIAHQGDGGEYDGESGDLYLLVHIRANR